MKKGGLVILTIAGCWFMVLGVASFLLAEPILVGGCMFADGVTWSLVIYGLVEDSL